ncbi:hypothetical protein Tco_0319225 [Tanacetum coccineum]
MHMRCGFIFKECCKEQGNEILKTIRIGTRRQGTSSDTKADTAPTYDIETRSEVPNHTTYSDSAMINVFDHEQKHFEISKSSQSTYVEPLYDSNISTATSDMHLARENVDQHYVINEEYNTEFQSKLHNFQVELDRCVMDNRDAKFEMKD